MKVEVTLQTTDANGHTFLTWAPVKGAVWLSDADGSPAQLEAAL
jgi:hypothetical protein